MAGSLPNVTSNRLALHLDGTRWFWRLPNDNYDKWYELSTDDLKNTQDAESAYYTGGSGNNVHHEYMLLFPEPRDIDGIRIYYNYYSQYGASGWQPTDNLYVSTDTTNGYDGTWTAMDPSSTYIAQWATTADRRYYSRTSIVPVDWNNVRGIRFRWNKSISGSSWFRIYGIHLYGQYPAGVNTDRLEFWHPTNDETLPPAHLDWGDVFQGATEIKYVRIKNLSATMMASGVKLTAPGFPEGDMDDAIEFSTSSGGTFNNMLEVGNLSAGEISDPIVVRYNVPVDEGLHPSVTLIHASPRDWV